MFLSLSKSYVVAGLDTSEAWLLVFGVVLLVGLYGEVRADHEAKKSPISKKTKRFLEEFENLRPQATASFFKKHKGFCAFLVVFGVAGELIADGGIFLCGRRLQIINDVEVSRLNKEAAVARLETAKLYTAMAKSDRSKWPVYSLTAEVRLRFNSTQELANELGFSARLTLLQSNVPARKVILTSANAVNVSPDESPKPRRRGKEERQYQSVYLLKFSNPFRPIPVSIPLPLWGKTPAKLVAGDLDTASLQITNFPAGGTVDVTSGNVTITINDIIVKQFRLNPGNINNGFGTLTGSTNKANALKLLQPE